MKRFASVTKVKPDRVAQYVELHADTWPDVLARIKACNIQNYSIFLKKIPGGEHYLFSYMEYTGEDFEADMEQMATDGVVQQWWGECKPCLEPIEDLPPEEVWATMQEIFHQD